MKKQGKRFEELSKKSLRELSFKETVEYSSLEISLGYVKLKTYSSLGYKI